MDGTTHRPATTRAELVDLARDAMDAHDRDLRTPWAWRRLVRAIRATLPVLPVDVCTREYLAHVVAIVGNRPERHGDRDDALARIAWQQSVSRCRRTAGAWRAAGVDADDALGTDLLLAWQVVPAWAEAQAHASKRVAA